MFKKLSKTKIILNKTIYTLINNTNKYKYFIKFNNQFYTVK